MLFRYNNYHRQVIVGAGLLIQCGFFGAGAVSAQGLDMDASTTAPTQPSRAGTLDMDVDPDTPIPPPAASPAPAASGTASLDDAPETPVAPPAPTEASSVKAVPLRIVMLDHPKVVNTALLQSGDTTVNLYGIQGLAGEPAQGLQSFLAYGDGKITCRAQETAGFVCLRSDGTNVAQAALVNGAATAAPGAPDAYREQEASAQAARRGIWINLPPPRTARHPVVRDTATLWAANQTFVLDGIIGFQAPYTAQLQGYIVANGDSVTCAPQPIPDHYICRLPDGTDVAKVALVNGAARVAPDAPDAYRVQQLDALNNHRGYWASAPQAVVTAALPPLEANPGYAFVAGDNGADGITYVSGEPMAIIDGEAVFLVLGGASLGWGYYDHYRHWHGAPDRYRAHLEHFHPDGRGLRGYDALRHDTALRGREEGVRPGEARPGEFRPGTARPGIAVAPAGRPGVAGQIAGGRPGMAGSSAAGGLMRPMPTAAAGGFHPAAAIAAAPHAAAPSPAKHK